MDTPLYQVFQRYGMNAEAITLPEGEGKPDMDMFREAIRQIKPVFGMSADSTME